MSSSSSNPDNQLYCYCPRALWELHQARDELVKVRTFLQSRDPDFDARESLKAATRELHESRQLLQNVLGASDMLEQLREAPQLCQQARAALDTVQAVEAIGRLSRIEAVVAHVERIERVIAMLDRVQDVRVVHVHA